MTDTSISVAPGAIPAQNMTACSESVSMDLAYPATMTSANATGAAATPGVSSPSGYD